MIKLAVPDRGLTTACSGRVQRASYQSRPVRAADAGRYASTFYVRLENHKIRSGFQR